MTIDPEKGDQPSQTTTKDDAVVLEHADVNDADVALKVLEGETIEMTPEMEKKLLRKIDLHLMPVRLTKFTEIGSPSSFVSNFKPDTLRCLRAELSGYGASSLSFDPAFVGANSFQ